MKDVVTWDELKKALDNAPSAPENTGWTIYKYMAGNVGANLSSEEARTLLLCYMKLPIAKPSLLHSCILMIAIKMADCYADFKLPAFLKMWGVRNLRDEDRQRTKAADGKVFSSLLERLTHAYMKYRVHHISEPTDEEVQTVMVEEARRMGYVSILPMVAVKVFETMKNGRKMRSVKLVGARGEEMLADSHSFSCPPWEIAGGMYEVLSRRSAEGNMRAAEVVKSDRKMESVFGKEIGYVDRFDEHHCHYHVYDNQSRHFVAESPRVKPRVGEYVWFCPIIPQQDKFKSAMILSTETANVGREAFGLKTLTVTYVNKEKDYFRYKLDDGSEGIATLSRYAKTIALGESAKAIVYLRRGKDGEKHNYLAEIVD